MAETETKNIETESLNDLRIRVRLPGFVLDEDVGLGTVVKRATSSFGIKPCGGCEQRAATLNRWLVFTGSRRK